MVKRPSVIELRDDAEIVAMLEQDRRWAAYALCDLEPRHRIAVIGNVFTDPAHRGEGLATAVTGAASRALFDQGMSEVALIVREDNPAAVAVYRRLGFGTHERFWEGRGRLRA